VGNEGHHPGAQAMKEVGDRGCRRWEMKEVGDMGCRRCGV